MSIKTRTHKDYHRKITSTLQSEATISGSASWNPTLLGSRVLGWWEADYGITLNSGRVSSWESRAGAASAVQATAANRPLYTTVGNRPSVQMDDTARFLVVPKASAPTPSTGATVYWVGDTTASTLVLGVWGLWGVAVADSIWLHVLNDATNAQTAAYINETGTNTNRASKGGGDPSDGNPHTNVLRWSGTGVVASLDSASAASVACAGAKTPSAGTSDMAIGRYIPTLANPAGVVNHRALIFLSGHEPAGSETDLLILAYLRKWGTP